MALHDDFNVAFCLVWTVAFRWPAAEVGNLGKVKVTKIICNSSLLLLLLLRTCITSDSHKEDDLINII